MTDKADRVADHLAAYYDQQYNARAMIPDHAQIFERWAQQSAEARNTTFGVLDVAYGKADEERLDFFPAAKKNAPLLVFIHGGWWRSLDKSDFSFVATAYTRVGFNVAITNYSLAPAASIGDITMQQVHALAWLYRNAKTLGYDRQRIVVAGHSAGAHLAAMMMSALWPKFSADLPKNLVKGGILMSGLYDLEPIRHAEFVNCDLKLQKSDTLRWSPATMPQAHAASFFTAVGGLESAEFKRQNAMIGQAWKKNHLGDVAVPDADHLTICDAFTTPGQTLFEISAKLVSVIH